jgi:hypothetical protein
MTAILDHYRRLVELGLTVKRYYLRCLPKHTPDYSSKLETHICGLIFLLTVAALPTAAKACIPPFCVKELEGTQNCSPTPTCWIEKDRPYLGWICQDFAKEHQSIRQIRDAIDDRKQINVLVHSCRKLGIKLGR